MGNIGTPEILVVLIVALLVLGPQRLPQAARQFGKAMAEFRRVTGGLQAEMRDAMSTIENEIKTATDTTGPQAAPPSARPYIFEPPAVGPAPGMPAPNLPADLTSEPSVLQASQGDPSSLPSADEPAPPAPDTDTASEA